MNKLPGSLQEDLLALMAYSMRGSIVAGMADPVLFEGDYRTIFERAQQYWRRWSRPPGDAHLPDLLHDILDDPHNRKAATFRRIITNISNLAQHLNEEYVVERLRKFARTQKLKSVVLEAAEIINAKQELGIEDVENILWRMLRARELNFDPGIRLIDMDQLLALVDRQQHEMTLGIQQFSARGIVPTRGTLMMLLAPPGSGKSWFAVHVGKHAINQRKRVLHITLEVSDRDVVQRYYQSLFSAVKRDAGSVDAHGFDVRNNKLQGISSYQISPEFAFDSPDIREELSTRIEQFGTRMQNIIIKQFPSNSLTVPALEAYLDNLDSVERFVPDLLVVDAPYLMKLSGNKSEYRHSLGQTILDLRRIAGERNIAVVGTHQVSRGGQKAKHVSRVHVAEDWSIIMTADFILTLSATPQEMKLGLARLFVDKGRSEEDKFGVFITQNFKTGQFVLDSVFMPSNYMEFVESLAGEDDVEDETDEDGNTD